MAKKIERKFTEVGSFNNEFHDWKSQKTIEGKFLGLVEITIDGEKRQFGEIEVEGMEKKQLVGGRDLMNKLAHVKPGNFIRATFDRPDTFTPKGTKKKVKINRYKLEVAE